MVLGGLWSGSNTGTASDIDAANRTAFAYYNTGLTASIAGLTGSESYSYDASGNRVAETGSNASGTYKNATAIYDALELR